MERSTVFGNEFIHGDIFHSLVHFLLDREERKIILVKNLIIRDMRKRWERERRPM